MENEALLMELIKNVQSEIQCLSDRNDTQHKEIIIRQDKTNGSIATVKTRQIYLRGILIGVLIVMLVFGFLPERIYDLIKSAF